MTAEPLAVSAETAVESALWLMAEHGIHHLPVVKASGSWGCSASGRRGGTADERRPRALRPSRAA